MGKTLFPNFSQQSWFLADPNTLLWRQMADAGATFKENTKFFFGGNASGLLCAYQFGQVFPETRSNIIIPSSIYYASRQVSLRFTIN